MGWLLSEASNLGLDLVFYGLAMIRYGAMRVYELVVVLRSSLAEAKRKKVLETLQTWVQGAKVVKEEAWGQKVLSYPIKKELSGVFHFFTLESEIGIQPGLEKRMYAHDDILRYLLIRTK